MVGWTEWSKRWGDWSEWRNTSLPSIPEGGESLPSGERHRPVRAWGNLRTTLSKMKEARKRLAKSKEGPE
jgi:hypothetical protein